MDINQLMKQAKQMQEQMQKAQEEAASKEFVGESGAGLVKVIINGRFEAKNIELDPGLIQEEKEVAEDLIIAAFNDAVRKVNESNAGQMSGLASGLNLPPDFKMPF